jgi:hypothetical protein
LKGGLTHPQKLDVITEIAMKEGRDPTIAELAVNILRSGKVAPRDYRNQAGTLLKWVQDNIYYINEPGERLQSPKYTLNRGFGDCDDMAILLCCMYESIGLPWKLVLSGNAKGKKVRHIQGEQIIPNVEWAHIYCMVGNQPFHPTQWYFAEPTIRGVPLGWDVVSANSDALPELLNPRYSGVSLAGPQSMSTSIATAVGITAGDIHRHKGKLLVNTSFKQSAITVVIGVATAIFTELALEYIRELRNN